MIRNPLLLKLMFLAFVVSLYTIMGSVIEPIGDSEFILESETGEGYTREPDENSSLPDITIDITNKKPPTLGDYEKPFPFTYYDEGESSSDTTAAATTVERYTAMTPSPPDSGGNANTNAAATVNNSSTDNEGTNTQGKNNADRSEQFKISVSGKDTTGEAYDIVTRVVQAEIGSAFHKEAIKAQAIAVYTYIKRQNGAGITPSLPLAAVASDRVKECVDEVFGKLIYHNGEIIQAVFCASSAGWTASALNVWGEDIPYLKSVECEFDEKYDPNRGDKATFKSEEVMTNVLRETGIQLSGDPSKWIKVLGNVDTNYVGAMSIGDQTSYKSKGRVTEITGRIFREKIMGFAIKSASFTFSYNKDDDTFTFVTNGYGHGAGLSQYGANALATHKGYSCDDILKHYYTDVTIS